MLVRAVLALGRANGELDAAESFDLVLPPRYSMRLFMVSFVSLFSVTVSSKLGHFDCSLVGFTGPSVMYHELAVIASSWVRSLFVLGELLAKSCKTFNSTLYRYGYGRYIIPTLTL